MSSNILYKYFPEDRNFFENGKIWIKNWDFNKKYIFREKSRFHAKVEIYEKNKISRKAEFHKQI